LGVSLGTSLITGFGGSITGTGGGLISTFSGGGVVMVCFTTGGTTGNFTGLGGCTTGGGGKVIAGKGGGGGGCVIGNTNCTTTSRTSCTLRCTGESCNSPHNKPRCNKPTANSAGLDKPGVGSWRDVV
jgi:hypothetical protein